VSAATLTVLGRYGAYPAPGGACRGLLLEGAAATDAAPAQARAAVLVGCGSGVAGRLGYHLASPARLAAVLLPDLRPDHCSDLWAVGSLAAAATLRGERRGLLPVYAFGRPPELWQRLHRPGVADVRRFAAADAVRLCGWTFTFAALDHPWPTLAVRAEGPGGPLALVGPGRPDDAVRALCAGATLLIVDVGGPRDVDEGLDGGMAPGEAGALAAACGAKRLLLAHLDPGAPAEDALAEARAAFPAAALALEGRTYDL
jgi:ribonuclease BN (tRNA processing enzyme)